MFKLSRSIVVASLTLLSAGTSFAQNETPSPAWAQAQGTMLTENSTTMKYSSYNDPAMKPTMGMVLPDKVKVYDMPGTMKDPAYQNYRYGMVNNHPVVVERTTRKVVHTWD